MVDSNESANMASDDEEDLELLRLAALKSINAKRDTSPKNQKFSSGNEINTTENKSSISGSGGGVPQIYYNVNHPNNQQVMQTYGHINPNIIRPGPPVHQPYFPRGKSFPSQQPPLGPGGIYGGQPPNFIPGPHPRMGGPPQTHGMNNVPPRPPGGIRPPHWAVSQQEQIPPNGNIYNANKNVSTYVPTPIVKDTHPSDVQLSPRSLAFVAQNNTILTRRKIEAEISPKKIHRRSKSPNYRRPSRSPSPIYRNSPGRWSVSPPPQNLFRPQRFSKSKSRSPPPLRRSRSKPPVQFNFKRSRSRSSSGSVGHARHKIERRRRSFSRNSSPQMHHSSRPSSRSPPPLNKMHHNVHNKRRSRSPILQQRRHSPLQSNYGMQHRRLSRSRSTQLQQQTQRRNYFNDYARRSRSPQQNRRKSPNNFNKRNQMRPGERKSPMRYKRKSPLNRERRDSRSPNNFNRRQPLRKSLSPMLQQQQPQNIQRRRSKSRSPTNKIQRKFIRKSRDRQLSPSTSNVNRKKSPVQNQTKRNQESQNYNEKNKIETEFKKSKSPSNKRRKSKSKSIEKSIPPDEETKNIQNENSFTPEKVTKESSIEKENKGESKEEEIESKTPPPELQSSTKAEKQTEDNFESLTPPIERDILDEDSELLKEIDAMLGDDDNSDDDSSDDDDGIDLFASEESESENEGRFKSSNKTERSSNVPTLSFAKLKESSSTSTTNIKNLHDIVNDEKFDDMSSNRTKKDYFRKYSGNRKNLNDNRRRGGGDDDGYGKRRSRSRSMEKRDRFSGNNKMKSSFQSIRSESLKLKNNNFHSSSSPSTSDRMNNRKRPKDMISSEIKPRKSTKTEVIGKNRLSRQQLMDEIILNRRRRSTLRREDRNNNKSKDVSSNSSKLSLRKNGKKIVQQPKNGGKYGSEKNSSSTAEINQSSKKSIYSRLGAMTNTFKGPTKLTPTSSSWD